MMASNRKLATQRQENRRKARARWLLQASALAGAVVLGTAAQHARAQTVASRMDATRAVQANESFVSGSGTVVRSATKDQVQVTTPTAIINWTTLDTATIDTTTDYVNFLPAGTEMEFVGTGSDYTVLNRIFSAPNAGGDYRGIAFLGSVTSRLNAGGAIGGNIWFYSPGGILVGSSGVFNVGSLVLTTSDLSSIDSGGNQLNFGGVTNPASSVIVQNGATINATNAGSYVAMFAPRVEQGGTVNVNGSAAYVGAESGQLTINNGLFDISVGVGTEDANGVVHTGTTTGSASAATIDTGTGNVIQDGQAIYLVAVPKNDAITMLVSGSLGFSAANSAALGSNGQIILSSGAGATMQGFTGADPVVTIDSANAVAGASIDVGDATFTSNVTAFASDMVDLVAQSGETISLTGDAYELYGLDVTAGNGVDIGAQGTGSVNILGDVSLRGGADQAQGAPINLIVSGAGASVNIGGNLTLDASGVGRDDFFIIRNNGNTGIGEDAVGGDITIDVNNGGNLTVGGTTTLDSSAQGGKGESRSGSSTGGNVSIALSGATSSLNLAGPISVNTNGYSAESGKIGGNGPAAQGAASVAGDFSLITVDGTLDLGSMSVDTSADGSSGGDGTIAQSNTGTSGAITVSFTGGTQDLADFGASNGADAGISWDGAGNGTAPAVTLGAVNVTFDGSQTTIAQDFGINNLSGYNDPRNPATANFTVTNGADVSVAQDFYYFSDNPNTTLLMQVDQGASLAVTGSLYFSFYGNSNDINTDSGAHITLNVDNASVTSSYFSADTTINNYAIGNLDLFGGNVAINLTNNALLDVGTGYIYSSAYSSVTGSNATGGTVSILVDSSTLRATGGLYVSADGVAAPSSISGVNATTIGLGGTVDFLLTGVNPIADLGDVSISADGSFNSASEEFLALPGAGSTAGSPSGAGGIGTLAGGGGGLGDGGNANGGDVTFTIDSGTFNGGDVSITSSGYGEDASSGIYDDGINPPVGYAGTGGTGTGGSVDFNLAGGTYTVNSLVVAANGLGGNGGYGDIDLLGVAAGAGGDGFGGTATINATGGTLNANQISLLAMGNAQLFIFSGIPYLYTYGSGGFGFGVNAGDGGTGTGGTATFDLNGSSTINAVTIDVGSAGYGGDGGESRGTYDNNGILQPGALGGSGGSSNGGVAVFNNTAGTIGFQAFTVDASAYGGAGGDHSSLSGSPIIDNGGAGGDATAGSATINLNQSDPTNPTYAITANAFGGNGGTGQNGGAGGNALGGNATLNVNNVAIVLNTLTLDTSSSGGDGGLGDGTDDTGNGGAGGSGTGGTSRMQVSGPAGSLSSLGPMGFSAAGSGGSGAQGGTNPLDQGLTGNGGAGGLGQGGLVQVVALGGASIDYTVDGSTDAAGTGGTGGAGGNAPFFIAGDGGAGGDGIGGRIEFSANGGSTINASSSTSEHTLDASGNGALGGDGGNGAGGVLGNPGQNGASAGGSIALSVDGAASFLGFNGNVIADASGLGAQDTRDNSLGNDGSGGDVDISATTGGFFAVDGGLWINAAGQASMGALGAGNSTGGNANLVMSGAGSNFEVTGAFDLTYPIGPRQRSLFIDVSAYEPQSGNPLIQSVNVGDVTGGSATIDFASGNSTFSASAAIQADAGARNPSSGAGQNPIFFLSNGAATGGTVDVTLTGGTHNWFNFTAQSQAYGPGGVTTAGRIDALLDGAQLTLTQANALFGLSTVVMGEIAVADPQAITLTLLNGASLSAPRISLFSEAHPASTGATVVSGDINMLVDNSTITSSSISLTTDSEAFFVFGLPGIGDTGADALAGNIDLAIRNGSAVTGDVSLSSFATGENTLGGDGGSATSGAIGYTLDNSTHTGVGSRVLSLYSFAEAQGASGVGGTSGVSTGGAQTVTVSGASSLTGGRIDLETSIYGYEINGNQVGAAPGGSGGPMTVNLLGGTVDVSSINFLSTVGADPGGAGAPGATLTGSDVTLLIDGAAVTAPNISVSTGVTGNAGGAGDGLGLLAGGSGGTAIGGNVLLDFASGSLDVTSIDVTSSATGGSGGDGAISVLNTGLGPGGPGGAGGDATGGNITVTTGFDLPNLTDMTLISTGTGGAGGNGALSANGGIGGNGQGGVITAVIGGTGALLGSLTDFLVDASAYGGSGGAGGADVGGVNSGIGGQGGSATAGTASFGIGGVGASLTVDPGLFVLIADAFGGSGGQGGGNFNGGIAGDGGDGGDATGGVLALTADSGSSLTLQPASGPFTLSASGTGGNGGNGGDIDQLNGGIAGNGGNGGAGTGGSPTLRATGGTISGGELALYAQGTGGNGGLGGTDFTVQLGATGNGGDGIGGDAVLETLDGSPGILQFGDVSIFANGLAGTGTISGLSQGGRIDINDLSSDPAGLITFASLTADATGDVSASGGGFYMIGGSGPVTISGNVQVDVAGDIQGDFTGDGQLLVGGSTTLNAGGDITIAHVGNPGLYSIDSTGSFTAFAGLSFTNDTGSAIRTGSEMFIFANGGSITANDLVAVPVIFLQALGPVSVTNAQALGPQGVSNVGGIVIIAGYDQLSGAYDPSADVALDGIVDSYSDITITAGGRVDFLPGSATYAGNAINVQSGDDIVVGSGATVEAALNPVSPVNLASPFASGPNINLAAGSVTFLSSPRQTPISSVVVDGSIDANSGAVILTGNAVDALDGSVAGSSLQVDINDAPANGVTQVDDGGLLDPNCVQGNVCLGAVFADNLLYIGQNSNNDVIQLIIQQGTVNADEIRVTTRSDIVMGTNGVATTLNGASLFSVQSTEGSIDLRDAAISSGQILIDAAGSLLGSASLTSASDIGITVGDSISASAITTGGELTTVADVGGALEGSYSVPGSMDVGTLSVGAGDVNYSAGGDLLFGAIIVPGTNIRLDAGGNVSLGATDTGSSLIVTALGSASLGDTTTSGATSVTADSVDVGSATTTGPGSGIVLLATGAGQPVSAGDLATNRGDILIQADGDISLASATTGLNDPAGAPVSGSIALLAGGNIDAANGAGASLSAGEDIAMSAGGDAVLGTLVAGDDIDLSAANVSLVDATALGTGPDLFSIVFGSGISFAAENPDLAGSNIRITSPGDIDVTGTLDAANNIAVTAGGTPGIANVISGANTSITGQSVTFNAGTVGGDLSLTATNGDVTSSGFVQAGGGIALTATGDIVFRSMFAQAGDLIVDAGGNIDFGGASANGLIDLLAGGNITHTLSDGFVSAAGDVSIEGNDVAVGDIDSGGSVSFRANSRNGVAGNITAAGTIDIFTGQYFVGSFLSAGGDVTADTGWDFDVLGVDSGGNVAIYSGGPVSLGTSSSVGDFYAEGGEINFDDIVSGASLTLAAVPNNPDAPSSGEIVGGTSHSATGSNFSTTDGAILLSGENSSDGNIDIAATGGGVNAAQLSASQSGTGQISVSADGDIAIDALLGNDAALTSNNGAVAVTQDIDLTGSVGATGTSVFLRSTHDLSAFASASAGDVDISTSAMLSVLGADATGDILLDAAGDVATLDDVRAGADLVITSGGTATFEAFAIGATVSVTSADIVLDDGSQLGDPTLTSSVSLDSTGDALLGGAGGATSGYELDNDEFSRIYSNGDLSVTANGGTLSIGDLDIVVGDGTSSGPGNIGAGGSAIFTGDSGVDITGSVLMTNAGSGNALRLRSGAGNVFLDAATGLVQLSDANGGLTGSIFVEAVNFYAMTSDALADIAGMDIADIDLRLADSDGLDRPDGIIRAGTLDIATSASDVFIQNTVSGTDYADRRGFEVDVLNIADVNGTNQPIVINGTIGGATGLDTIPLANLPTGYAAGSTINGCLIANPASCGATTTTTTDTFDDPTRDLLDDDLQPGSQGPNGQPGGGDSFQSLLIELRDPKEYDQDPLIDDPVTGAGNEDFWDGGSGEQCQRRDDDGQCIPVGGGQQGGKQ